jgi:hypothetical protein
MTTVEEFRSELVKGMTAITRAGQQDDRSPRPAPIEEFKCDARLDRHEPNLVLGWILP